MPEPDAICFTAAERRDQVRRALARVEGAGGVVPPVARALYGRYIVGELTLGQVCHQVDTYAALLSSSVL